MARSDHHSNKVVDFNGLVSLRDELKLAGLSLAQCHGCFDVVHPGHIRHLKFAASQADKLVVSITADEFVNKGDGRPMFAHGLRAENLAALEFVDWVYIHHEPTAVSLLSDVKPNIYIKGAEYLQNDDPRFANERQTVERYGGRVVFSSGDVVYSSTAIAESIKKSSREAPSISQLEEIARSHDFSNLAIQRSFANAKNSRVLVVGETILDTYVDCQWPEIADEHPMLSLRPTNRSHYDGGAAVVALHAAAMGAKPTLCTLLPNNRSAQALVQRLNASGVEVLPIKIQSDLSEKERYIVGREKVMKLDRTSRVELTTDESSQFINSLNDLEPYRAMILTDFGLGLFSGGLASKITDKMRDRVELITGDVSGGNTNLVDMLDADVLCPSESEIRRAMNDHESSIDDVALRLMEITNALAIVVTFGQEGLRVVTADQRLSLPALSNDPVDVLGCGDALLALLSLSILGGSSLVEASYIGSIAAAEAGSRIGNDPVRETDIFKRSLSMAALQAEFNPHYETPGRSPQAVQRNI
jgi:rfaE bifunctional protein kinase chain/domain/rfaE bifunctional protein nucleotidyltransferase chain/domain